MKKYICFFVLTFAVSALYGRTIYVTRHAQVGDKAFYNAAVREWMITDLGKKQVELLADYLINRKNFNGTIYVSPFYRTIETGAVIAGKLYRKVILEPGIQEIAPHGGGRFMSGKTIAAQFPGKTVLGRDFNDNWRVSREDSSMRYNRVAKALRRMFVESSGDLLLVSHGGTCSSIVNVLNSMRKPGVKPVKGMPWNCALFIFNLDDDGRVISGSYTTEYMPDDIVTNNFRAPKVPKPDDHRYEMRRSVNRSGNSRKQ